jgi:hypothetical protein
MRTLRSVAAAAARGARPVLAASRVSTAAPMSGNGGRGGAGCLVVTAGGDSGEVGRCRLTLSDPRRKRLDLGA